MSHSHYRKLNRYGDGRLTFDANFADTNSISEGSLPEEYSLDRPSAPVSIEKLRKIEEFQRRVIYEDNHLLVVDKPICLATQGAASGEESLFTLAQNYVKVKYNKPGAVYLGVVSRLDFPVSGVVVFARTSKSASRLNEHFKTHTVRKFYQALLEGTLSRESGELVNFICEDKNTRRLWITDNPKANSRFSPKESRLSYRTLEKQTGPKSCPTTLVEIELFTGRKHQIRLQFSNQGAPIMADGKYGAQVRKQPGICLHACRLTLTHPTTKRLMTFSSCRPDWSNMR